MRALHAVLHLAAAVAAHVVGEARELDQVGGLDGGAKLRGSTPSLRRRPASTNSRIETRLGQPRAVGSERGQSRCEGRQRARAGRSRAGVIDEWAHQRKHRRLAAHRLSPNLSLRRTRSVTGYSPCLHQIASRGRRPAAITWARMTAVLVIEDDGVIARAMGAHLRNAGFDVEWADDGTKGLRKLRFERPDVCVVDLMLPGLDGWGLIERARDEGLMTPILAVSARGNEHDKVATLSLGADDYLAKPFGMAEFMARVQALARRSRIAPPSDREQALEFPGLRIDPAQHRAFLLGSEGGATDARLTRTEFRLLHQLARNDGRVLSRDELHQRVWDVPYRAPRPHGRRLRAQAAREARPPLQLLVRAHALRRRLPLRRRGARERRARRGPERIARGRRPAVAGTIGADPHSVRRLCCADGRPRAVADASGRAHRRLPRAARLRARAAADGRSPLARLHRAHLERIPFENLDIHLGVRIGLDAARRRASSPSGGAGASVTS